MMYFEFNEDKLKQNNLTKEQCFRVIDKVMNMVYMQINQEHISHPMKVDLMRLVY